MERNRNTCIEKVIQRERERENKKKLFLSIFSLQKKEDRIFFCSVLSKLMNEAENKEEMETERVREKGERKRKKNRK